jgi:hypothetical protein
MAFCDEDETTLLDHNDGEKNSMAMIETQLVLTTTSLDPDDDDGDSTLNKHTYLHGNVETRT